MCTQKAIDSHINRYDEYFDNMSDKEYGEWTETLFTGFDAVLAKNGVILYNISYGSENPNAMWVAVEAIRRAGFMVADTIIWKKKSALPNNTSSNKLTRITEFVFVVCRQSEFATFQCNKGISGESARGQKYYNNVFNFIEAPNNDGSNKLNKATFSSELVLQLLNIYALDNSIVFDPFMGTGTTAIGCLKYNDGQNNLVCVGSEISVAQVEFAKERVENFKKKTCN